MNPEKMLCKSRVFLLNSQKNGLKMLVCKQFVTLFGRNMQKIIRARALRG